MSCRSRCDSHLGELRPVKRLVALEKLSSQVTVLPVHFLRRHNKKTMKAFVGDPKTGYASKTLCSSKRGSYVVFL